MVINQALCRLLSDDWYVMNSVAAAGLMRWVNAFRLRDNKPTQPLINALGKTTIAWSWAIKLCFFTSILGAQRPLTWGVLWLIYLQTNRARAIAVITAWLESNSLPCMVIDCNHGSVSAGEPKANAFMGKGQKVQPCSWPTLSALKMEIIQSEALSILLFVFDGFCTHLLFHFS